MDNENLYYKTKQMFKNLFNKPTPVPTQTNDHLNFFYEDVDPETIEQVIHNHKLIQCADREGIAIRNLNVIFCSDEYLLEINKKYLKHDYYTDVITFDTSSSDELEGDVFISVERARKNSKKFRVKFKQEVKRLMLHGVLHLIGYNDKTEKEKKIMREKEDCYLSLWS